MGTEFQKHVRSKGLKIGTVWVTHQHPNHYQATAVDGAALHGGSGWVKETGYTSVRDAEAAIRRYDQSKSR